MRQWIDGASGIKEGDGEATKFPFVVGSASPRRGECRCRGGELGSVVLQDAPQGSEAVFPADMLAFVVGAAVLDAVGNDDGQGEVRRNGLHG